MAKINAQPRVNIYISDVLLHQPNINLKFDSSSSTELYKTNAPVFPDPRIVITPIPHLTMTLLAHLVLAASFLVAPAIAETVCMDGKFNQYGISIPDPPITSDGHGKYSTCTIVPPP